MRLTVVCQGRLVRHIGFSGGMDGLGAYTAVVRIDGETSYAILVANNAAAFVSSGVPFTWAAGDEFSWQIAFIKEPIP